MGQKIKSTSEKGQEYHQYSVFIKGETVDLCTPSKSAIINDGWAEWFNDDETTKYLDQGIFPNTIEDQLEFYEGLKEKTRFLLLIKAKRKRRVVGVISLSNINMFKRMAQISMVLGVREKNKTFYALESMARVGEHGFEKIGLERIYAGQAFPALKKWNQRLELLGYRSEGIGRRAFIKGRWISDTVSLACIYEDYLRLKELRKGKYWPGEKKMEELIKALPEQGFAEIVNSLISEASEKYFNSLKYI
ncbi:MAG: GNAT family protein [Thermodesulfobacteriota bacterium]|nr:GNAT family protein [Thermodesulfobacteriota bacterium]